MFYACSHLCGRRNPGGARLQRFRPINSAAVLKIEVSGPNGSYFSILDIPGIFVNDYNVCDGEMDGVRNMVVEYMKQPESIVM